MTSSSILLRLSNGLIGLVEFFISLRIILKFFGANATAPFVSWVYQTTDPLLAPFVGMFPSPKLPDGFTLEFAALFALFVYAFIGYIVTELIAELSHRAERRGK